MKKHTLFLFLNLLPLLLVAQVKPNVDKNGIGLGGYDPVSYFSGTPAAGNENLTSTWNGVTYRFATAANKAAFEKNPAAYEPAYGGWCAYAVGKSGEQVEIDPKTFKILDGKLLLFYNKWFTNTLPLWNKDEKALHAKAEETWKKWQTSKK